MCCLCVWQTQPWRAYTASDSWQGIITTLSAHYTVLLCSWACTAHFCYLCRQTLRGTKGASGSHFGKAGSGKCRQHSAD